MGRGPDHPLTLCLRAREERERQREGAREPVAITTAGPTRGAGWGQGGCSELGTGWPRDPGFTPLQHFPRAVPASAAHGCACTTLHVGAHGAVPCRAVPGGCSMALCHRGKYFAGAAAPGLQPLMAVGTPGDQKAEPGTPPFLAPVSSMLSAPPGPPCPMCDIQRPCVTSTQGREGSVAHAAPCTEHGNGRDVAGAVPGVGASPTPCPDQSHLDFMSRGTGDGWLWRLLLFQERSLGSEEFSVGKTTAMQSTG